MWLANLFLLVIFVGAGFWIKDLYLFSQVIRSSENLSPLNSESEVDLVVVLTGGQGRFKAGLELLGRFPKAWLLVSGAESYVTLDDVLSANGVSSLPEKERSRIWLGKFSRNTVENAIEVRSVAEKLEAHNILLVTSSYHVRRALELLRREMAESKTILNPKIYYHPVESPNFPKSGWWRRVIGWKIFFSEYFKSIQLLPPPDDERSAR